MEKHTLFMLSPWTEDNGAGPYYCPDCGVVEGFLYYSPEIRAEIEIVSVDFPRPRVEIVELLGLEHQGSPVLILAEGATPPAEALQSMSSGRYFINYPIAICNFLGKLYGGVLPHP